MYVEFLPFYYPLMIRLPLLLELLSKSVPVTLAQKSEPHSTGIFLFILEPERPFFPSRGVEFVCLFFVQQAGNRQQQV